MCIYASLSNVEEINLGAVLCIIPHLDMFTFQAMLNVIFLMHQLQLQEIFHSYCLWGKCFIYVFFSLLKMILVIYFLALELIAVVCTIQRDHIIYIFHLFIVISVSGCCFFFTFYSLIHENFKINLLTFKTLKTVLSFC